MPSNPALRASETTAPTSKWATQGYIDCGRQFKRTGKHLPECPLGHADPAVSAPRVPEETPELTRTPICGKRYSHYGTINPPLMCTYQPGHAGSHRAERDDGTHSWPENMSDAEPAVLPTADAPTAEELEWLASEIRVLMRMWEGASEHWVSGRLKDVASRRADLMRGLASRLPSLLAAPTATSSTYGDLPASIRALFVNHEWDNRTPSEQRDWIVQLFDASLLAADADRQRMEEQAFRDGAQFLASLGSLGVPSALLQRELDRRRNRAARSPEGGPND